MNPFDRTTWVEAAVLVLLWSKDGKECILLTRRTEEVLHHKGEICFPGGARDPEDSNLWATALRETHEEVGIEEQHIIRLKELPQQKTPSGFCVTPFLGEVKNELVLTPNTQEIAEILLVPLEHLRNPKNFSLIKKEWETFQYVDPTFEFGPHKIWGMTGRVLCDLLAVC